MVAWRGVTEGSGRGVLVPSVMIENGWMDGVSCRSVKFMSALLLLSWDVLDLGVGGGGGAAIRDDLSGCGGGGRLVRGGMRGKRGKRGKRGMRGNGGMRGMRGNGGNDLPMR